MNDLAIIGYEAALARGLTQLMLEAVKRRHDWKKPVEERRGYHFDVDLYEPGGKKATGIIARVTVEILPREAKEEA